MREKAEKEGTATYDRRWRPEEGKTLPEIPTDVQPVVRFKTPLDGVTKWTDLVKGEISIPNEALDDLIIARADGTPNLQLLRCCGRLRHGRYPRYPW